MSSNFVADKNKISIIGTISIPKIDIKYPILSDYSDELLKISVCKFYGPNINDVGNLCIIGHNYNTNVFFSKVFLLKINDQIILTDSNLNSVTYFIYNTYEVEPNDLSYLSQDTNRY